MNIGPTLKPKVSFMPVIMNAISNPGQDKAAKDFAARLGVPLCRALLDNWNKLQGQEKARRFYLSRDWRAPSGDFTAQMTTLSSTWQAARAQLLYERKRLIRAEVTRALVEGVGRYSPSGLALKDKALAYEIMRKLYAKLFGCRCEVPGNGEQPPQAQPKRFGLKLTKIKCHDQRENGHDEIYLVSVIVDGNGQMLTDVSPKYSLDDDDHDVSYPNRWIYPVQDPAGFLDLGIAMWEDDGGYGQAGQTVATIGGAIASIPNPYTIVAGVAIAIIGELISLASWLDDDDHYGDAYKTWPSASSLESGVGSHNLSYYEGDTGLFDDGHDLDVTIQVISA